MQISLAPLEGITGYIVRNAFHHNFDGIDKFYTPFISAGQNLKGKALRDILPENNEGITLIPQLMSNCAKDVQKMSRPLAAYGYDEINLNIGCPSGTVTSKKRGAGLLTDLELLDHFLEEVFAKIDIQVSVKTRVGYYSTEEWHAILEIYQKYPVKELIIHPRVREEFYKGTPHLDCFELAVQAYADASPATATTLCYNGDITSVESCRAIREKFPDICHIMIGRGLISHPGLAAQIKYAKESGMPTKPCYSDAEYRERIRNFHDEIYSNFCANFSGEKDAMLHMKEIWGFLKDSFADSDKAVKKILKSQNCMEYKIAVQALLGNPQEYPVIF
jgi:tRNA-dihydrouridine synthase